MHIAFVAALLVIGVVLVFGTGFDVIGYAVLGVAVATIAILPVVNRWRPIPNPLRVLRRR